MYRVILRTDKRIQRKLRVRKKIYGTLLRPRLTVFRSNKYIYGQLIDDDRGVTLVDSSSTVKKMHEGKKKAVASFEIGKLLAKLALEKKIASAVFDRNGYRYMGRVKSLAEGAREGGLQL